MRTREKLITTSIKISPEQKKLWLKECSRYGYESLSEFIRVLIEQQIKMGGATKDDIQLLANSIMSSTLEIKRVGNNLNQIARHANSTGDIQQLDDALIQLENAIHDNNTIADSVRSTMFRRLGTSRKWKPKK